MDISKNTESTEYISIAMYYESAPSVLAALFDHCQSSLAELIGDVLVRTSILTPVDGERVDRKSPVTHLRSRLSASLNISSFDLSKITELHMYSRRGVPRQMKSEYLFFLNYRAPHSFFHHMMGPCLTISVRIASLKAPQLCAMRTVCGCIMSPTVTSARITYGLADVGGVLDIGHGTLYRSGWPIGINFQRLLERMVWIRTADRRTNLARGVYWGNLFSSSMMKSLGGDDFVKQYSALDDQRDNNLVTAYPDGSAFVTLSRSIATFMYPRVGIVWSTLDRAAWLHERLAAAGLLTATMPLVRKFGAE